MGDFITTHIPEIILSLISAGALGFCKYACGQMKNYKKLLEQQDEHEVVDLIRKELKPINDAIKDLQEHMTMLEDSYSFYLNIIVGFYKFKLIRTCKFYLEQGYITSSQFEELSELHKVYNSLGGNNQGDEYYEKAKRLPVKDEDEK